MKKLSLLAALPLFLALLVLPSMSQTRVNFDQFTMTNAHAVATNITSTNLFFTRATLIGLKAGGVSNSAAVFVGPVSNSTYYVIAPGERHIIEVAPPQGGVTANFKSWWVRTPTVNDGITVIFNP
jgi:hypothetical protein